MDSKSPGQIRAIAGFPKKILLEGVTCLCLLQKLYWEAITSDRTSVCLSVCLSCPSILLCLITSDVKDLWVDINDVK
jgi:hypothetical protein